MIKVYGDVMLDKWVTGFSDRISPEAPVPILNEVSNNFSAGGAANLAENIANLNIEVELYGAIGNDQNGQYLKSILSKQTTLTVNFLNDATHTTIKTRFVGQGGQHLMRLDNDHRYCSNQLIELFLKNLTTNDLVVISDYNKGSVNLSTVKNILSVTKNIYVDPKQDPSYYHGAYLVKPNLKEFNSWFGGFTLEKAFEAVKKFNWSWLLVTCGSEGIWLFDSDNNHWHFTEPVQEVADVTGAGDSVLAALVYSISLGHDVPSACKIACYAGARSVEHRGSYKISISDLENKVIFTNGCFDILHAGHLHLLQTAKSLGNKLVVGINSDSSVKKIKGVNRPINSELKRKQQLELLPWVDEVIIFNEETPYNLIKELKPSIIVKGSDYQIDTVIGNDLATVYIVPLLEDFSTSRIVNKIKK
jgi:D-beta-D-heptose 7-phosphate kinase/D-beta-D-heptose 1-phosphate adenosyltransferase